MSDSPTRRKFLRSTISAAALTGLGDLGFLQELQPVARADANLPPDSVRFDPSIEGLVRLLEETPRARLLEEVAARLRKGLTYKEVLAALLLAGVRNVQPRPSVGFKFHAVLVVNSAHLASLASRDEDRWLPIFWALDHFKSSQARDVQEGDWTMSAVSDDSVPASSRARHAFVLAMDQWDEPAADAATAGLARGLSSDELFALFCRYGARDFRSIGHKAIFVANSWRTLEHIGWQHSEPVLRSLAYALLAREGSDPLKQDLPADRPYRRNQTLLPKIPASWLTGRADAGVSQELLAELHTASDEQACDAVVATLRKGFGSKSIWDALFAASAEMLIRKPGIVALHAVTTTNAMHHNFQKCRDEETRKLMLLQNAAFLPMFRNALGSGTKEARLTEMEAEALAGSQGPAGSLEEIFAEVSTDRARASRKMLGFLKSSGNADDLLHAARMLIFLKGDDAHDYKFSSAVLEDYAHVAPDLRNHYLAASAYLLPGSRDADNTLVQRTRAALKG